VREVADALPRQAWDAEFQLDAAGLAVETLQSVILIRSDLEGVQSNVIVVAHITDDISLAPSVLNFGKIAPGEAAEAKLMIWVKGGHRETFRPADVSICSDTGHEIDREWKQSSGGCWLLKLRLKPSALPGTLLSGKLILRFPKGISERTVQYTAWVKAD
jgi:hypothetical protein